MNRRDLLKYFGIGATITPLVDGMPKVEAAAKLIEVPILQPITLAQSVPTQEDFIKSQAKACDIQVMLRASNGNVWRFKAKTFVTHIKLNYPPGQQLTWEFYGVCMGQPNARVAELMDYPR